MIAALVLCLGGGVPAVTADVDAGRLRSARVELAGPLERVRLAVEPMGETLLRGPLAGGERRTVVVPLPTWGEVEGLVPEVTVDGAGAARFLGWDPSDARADAAWRALPASLRRRPRPVPPPPSSPAVPLAALLAAAAALAAGWALRGRPLRAVGVSVLGAVATAAAVETARAPAATAGIRVLEGEGEPAAWFAVDAARERLVAPAGTSTLRVESIPERARLVYEVRLDPERGGGWTLAGRGAVLVRIAELASEEGGPSGSDAAPRLSRGANELADLAASWVRAADGSGWRALGPWARGTAEPSAGGAGGAGAAADPPGALNPALPLGRRVLVGRLAPGGPPSRPAEAGAVWVRLVGLD